MALGHDPALSPSGRASAPIAKARTRSIEGTSDRFAFSSELQFGAFGKVLDEADIQCIGGLLPPTSPPPQSIPRPDSRAGRIGGGPHETRPRPPREAGAGDGA